VSSVGNHEFDHGQAELLRMQNGGCYPGGMIGRDTCLQGGSFPGAKFQYLAANVVDTATGKTVLPATWTRRFGAVSIGFVGVTLKGTPEVVTASGVAGLSFTDEAAAINAAAAQLKAQGASAVVALIHQGGYVATAPLEAPNCGSLAGAILPIVDALGRDVDVVVSGHTHQAYVCTRNGKLLTQAGLYGSAVTDIDLTIQPGAGVTAKAARNRPVINDLNTTGQLPPGYAILAKDPDVDAAVRRYVGASQAVRNQVVGTISADIQRALLPGFSGTVRDETAEGAMGDLMADVYLAGGPRADIAFITPGGVRADLLHGKDGTVSVNDLLTVAPFGNTLVTVDLTGAQLLRLLEQQWEAPNCSAKTGANGCGRLLHPSAGFSYAWDARTPQGAPSGQGHRVVDGSMRLNGQPIAPQASYRVTVNSFMAPGAGDNFSVLTQGAHITDSGVKDIDAFVAYMQRHPRLAPPAARVQRLH
ncbi:MAG TPA: 5'-nucleotidase C-terminal domain-containing protein, partial [Variovorax sp.]